MNDQDLSEGGKSTVASDVVETKPTSELKAAPSAIGSWQCPKCLLAAMTTWTGSPNPDDAPTCCGGELTLPYRIIRDAAQFDRDVHIVSRWIDDIEAEAV